MTVPGPDIIPIAFLTATVLSLFLAGFAWAQRQALRGGRYFSLMMLAVSTWLFTSLMEDLSATAFARITWSQIQYFGVVSVAPLWLLFALDRSRNTDDPVRLSAAWRWAIWVIPLLVLVLALTHRHPGHGWVWRSVTPLSEDPGSRLRFEHGPAVWLIAVYSYTLMLWGSVMLVRCIRRADVLYRRQSLVLILAAAVPMLGNVVYILGRAPVPGVDVTPLAFALSGLLLAWGVFRFHLFSISPMAHDALFRDMADGVIVVDDTGRIREANPAARRMLGLAESVAGRRACDVLAGFPDLVRLAERTTPEAPSVRFEASGGGALLSVRAAPLGPSGAPRGRLLFITDVSGERSALRALRRRDAILEAVRLVAAAFLREPPVLAGLPRALSRLGAAVETDSAFVVRVSAEDAATGEGRMIAVWERDPAGPGPDRPALPEVWMQRICRGETLMLHGEGAAGPDRARLGSFGVHSLLAVPVGVRNLCWGAVGFGAKSENAMWSEVEIDALRTTAEALGAALEREQTESEQAALREQLFEAQKMESVGRLAGGIAHDFNNVLQSILGFSELLFASLPDEDARRLDVQEIQGAAKRAALLTHQLLAFGRKQLLQAEPMDLNAMLRGLEGMLRRMAGDRFSVALQLDAALPHITADVDSLSQVVMNLTINARDAMPDGGRLIFRTRRARVPDPRVRHAREARPGAYVVMEVADTGVGMSAEVREHVFEPFFSTKKQQPGAGMGLPMSYGIIRQHGGWIEIDSDPGRGTTVRVYLPMALEPAGGGEVRGGTGRAAAGGIEPGRILVVEDEPGILKLAERLLRQAGYPVCCAATLSEARRIYAADPEAIGLLLTDVMLPDGNGLKMAAELAERRPDLRVLVMTGYADDREALAAAHQRNWTVLPKPWRPAELVQSVERVLGRSAAEAQGKAIRSTDEID